MRPESAVLSLNPVHESCQKITQWTLLSQQHHVRIRLGVQALADTSRLCYADHSADVMAAAKPKMSAYSAMIFSVGLPAPCPALVS